MAGPTEGTPVSVALCDVIQHRLPEILARWENAVRSLHPDRGLSEPALRDYLPQILQRIASGVKAVQENVRAPLDTYGGEVHAESRLDEGFDLESVAAEFAVLRKIILDVWQEQVGRMVQVQEVARLNEAIDVAVTMSVTRFAASRERTLKALDRISAAALGSGDVDAFLPKLIQVLQETNEAVDSVVILLRQGEWLRIRAAVGLVDRVDMLELRVGDRFAGRIASERRPALLRIGDEAPDYGELEVLVRNNLKVVYGAPLIHEDEVIGVAHMGSRTAPDFSDADKQLFRAMATRATSLIAQAQLIVREREARREAENAVALLDTILAASPVGVAFLDRELRFVRINKALAAATGKSVQEHLGRTVREVLPEFADVLEPGLRRVVERGEPLVDLEFTGSPPAAAGLARHWLAYYYPVRSPGGEPMGVGGLVFDITDRKRAEKALQDSEARLQSILDHAPVAIYIKDSKGRFLLANRRLGEIMGMPRNRIVGQYDRDLLPRETADVSRANDQQVLAENKALHFEEVLPLPDGPHTFLSTKFPLPNVQGGPMTVCGISTDITDRKRAEEDMKRTATFREQFLGMVGHDLRNPLNAIRMTASYLLRDEGDPERLERQALRILNASNRMVQMLDELYDFVRGRLGGGIPVQIAAAEMEEIARIVVDEHRAAHPDRTIEFKSRGDTRGRWDPTRVAQVISNLVVNAIHYGDPDAPVTVSLVGRDREVLLEVQNFGPPIPEDVRGSLFEPFRRGRKRTGKDGLGLGLFIVDQIARAHGGGVEVRSSDSEGTTFSVRWPRHPPE
jgi:PAS domain S-box-containing protein